MPFFAVIYTEFLVFCFFFFFLVIISSVTHTVDMSRGFSFFSRFQIVISWRLIIIIIIKPVPIDLCFSYRLWPEEEEEFFFLFIVLNLVGWLEQCQHLVRVWSLVVQIKIEVFFSFLFSILFLFVGRNFNTRKKRKKMSTVVTCLFFLEFLIFFLPATHSWFGILIHFLCNLCKMSLLFNFHFSLSLDFSFSFSVPNCFTIAIYFCSTDKKYISFFFIKETFWPLLRYSFFFVRCCCLIVHWVFEFPDIHTSSLTESLVVFFRLKNYYRYSEIFNFEFIILRPKKKLLC